MRLLLYQGLMLLSCYKYISCNNTCGPRINVSGAEGGGASLPVRIQGQIKDITWIINDSGRVNHFATTKPNETVDIRDNQYEGRLRSETDASLTLTDLTNQDQGIYAASIRLRSNQLCDQLYHLQVYKNLSTEDIQIHANITHNETCDVTLTLSCAVIGSDVTVTWNNTNSPGTEVTNHTLRVYNAYSDVTYTCTARNPVSKASRTAHIPVTCNRASIAGNIFPWWIALILVLILAAVGIPSAVFYYLFKRKKKDQHIVQVIKGQTIYAQVQKRKRETVSGPGTEEATADSSVTVYSEVQLPKVMQQNIKGGKATNEKSTQEKAETVYSEVNQPVQGNGAGIRKENTYTEDQTVESCYDSVKNIQAANNTMDPLSNVKNIL
ncbi:SLAM family member 5 isoform X2 [Xenopus laevis]|uniref:SLAM family member 5 isoform X2 n=1 Tax=Xenopus laevis TaxID=8355 RepID=A0A8J0TLN9_XENLA|nr:SLAM family member 5 isoform X2 [Xenopus laevis]